MPRWGLWLFWFALGGCIGSFLNVCIYRMPREESLVRPRSRCPRCGHPIAWSDNIPLLSWAALRGRCRHCGSPIRWRYPVVELLTASLTVAVLYRFGAGPVGWVYVAFVAALIAVSFIDLEFQIIPDEISLGGLGLGVLLSALLPALHGTDARMVALGRSVVGLLVGGGVLYVTGLVGDLIFRKESMGGGDIKLMAMAGSLLGWKAALVAFFLAPFLALLPGLYVLAFKRSHVIPYGPFLSLALGVSLFFGADLLRATGMEETVKLMWEYYGPN
ncbi:MAG: prepilin peptidase [Candidatus Omnitrophica bacterium]|nr:prepilin peptidase [Candidatus Omnitrophota bacterium]